MDGKAVNGRAGWTRHLSRYSLSPDDCSSNKVCSFKRQLGIFQRLAAGIVPPRKVITWTMEHVLGSEEYWSMKLWVRWAKAPHFFHGRHSYSKNSSS